MATLNGAWPWLLAAVLVLVAVLILVVVLVLILVLVVVLVAIFVLAIHVHILQSTFHGLAAILAYPVFQDLSLALNIRLTTSPAKMATAIPPAQAFKPPVKIPRKPSSVMASFTPLARL